MKELLTSKMKTVRIPNEFVNATPNAMPNHRICPSIETTMTIFISIESMALHDITIAGQSLVAKPPEFLVCPRSLCSLGFGRTLAIRR
jgi:hypothetical protein